MDTKQVGFIQVKGKRISDSKAHIAVEMCSFRSFSSINRMSNNVLFNCSGFSLSRFRTVWRIDHALGHVDAETLNFQKIHTFLNTIVPVKSG